MQVLWEVDLEVGEGEWVALLGVAGAGKSTLMKTVAGLLPMVAGHLEYLGEDLTAVPAHLRVRRGISLVPEGRRLFAGMTVQENLVAGGFVLHSPRATDASLDRVYALFPALADRRRQVAGTLSGGEQQMCAIGRALMPGPRLLLVDELSLGLAPVIVDGLLEALSAIRTEGTTVLMVEQDVKAALTRADRGYVLRQGRIVKSGASDELLTDPEFQRDFLGY
jgi:branched-chain amino acid transport system ATP-binding protein